MENILFGDVSSALHENVIISKKIKNKDVSRHNAFSVSDILSITITIPRYVGVNAISLLIHKDGNNNQEIKMDMHSQLFSDDLFSLKLNLKELCMPYDNGLFFYSFKITIGTMDYFCNSLNNVDCYFSNKNEHDFCMLVHTSDFTTPEWVSNGIMYHIFVDRFFEGNTKTPLRTDAIRNNDWENGIPEYAPYPGAHLENNEFFGGNLWGVIEKLSYLKNLGVTIIYLSPIFEAYSNHKYDTGNYMHVDDMFGGDDAFRALLSEAKKYDIKIILDGVFNHTGDKSVYFDINNNYGTIGAYHNLTSKYREWFHFNPDNTYKSWWGIKILPKLNLACESCKDYFTAPGGVIEKYLLEGIGGWRLDVADELTDDFLYNLRSTAKTTYKDAFIIGEVWENATEKVAYDKRREYFRGKQLDSVMNYPFKNALINYIKYGNSEVLYNELTEIYSSYPLCVSNALMNLLGTHDTERILTVLSDDNPNGKNIDEIATSKLTPQQRQEAINRLKVASTIQYTVYGFPSVFYGDEAGIEGYGDPFCRKPFPWHNIDSTLHNHYKKLGEIRSQNKAFDGGSFEITKHQNGLIVFKRKKAQNEIIVAANAGINDEILDLEGKYIDLLTDSIFVKNINLAKTRAVILKKIKKKP